VGRNGKRFDGNKGREHAVVTTSRVQAGGRKSHHNKKRMKETGRSSEETPCSREEEGRLMG